MIIAIAGSAAILIIGGLVFSLIHKNHQTNELMIDKCFEDFGEESEIVINKDGFW